MSTPAGSFDVQLDRLESYRFRITFEGTNADPVVSDEPPPLGGGAGPNPARLLAAAIGNCLAASLLFALGKKGVRAAGMSATVHVELARNERNRLRIGKVAVEVKPVLPEGAPAGALDEAAAVFEDFCVVTQSVREGLPIEVRVTPQTAAA